MLRKSSRLASVWLISGLGVALCAPLARAQDAPPAADAPAGATAPSAPASAEEAPGVAPPSVASPAPSGSAEPDGAVPSAPAADASAPVPGNAAPTGSAAFEPLPDAPPEPSPKKLAPAAVAAPPPAAAPAPELEPTYHRSEPSSAPDAGTAADKSDDDEGLFGPFRIGFLIGGGLPDLLSLGGQIKLTRYFGAGINAGLIPTVKISLYGQAQIAFQEYDLYGHIYPFGGAFFLGAGVGYATVKGSLANTYTIPPPYNATLGNSASIDSEGSVRTLVLTPQIGFLKTFGAGFSIGVDVGAQVPIAPSQVDNKTQAPSYIPAEQIKPYDDKVHSTLTTIGRQVLPTINLKIGWLL